MEGTFEQGGFVVEMTTAVKRAWERICGLRATDEYVGLGRWSSFSADEEPPEPELLPASTDEEAHQAIAAMDSLIDQIARRTSEPYIAEAIGWFCDEWPRVHEAFAESIGKAGSVVKGVCEIRGSSADDAFRNTLSDYCRRLEDSPDEAVRAYHRLKGFMLLKQVELLSSTAVSQSYETPNWNPELSELSFRVRKKKYRRGATNVRLILAAFQEDGWRERIDDPLPGGRNPERLRDAIRTLNENGIGLRFEADGSGEGARWRPDEDSAVRPS